MLITSYVCHLILSSQVLHATFCDMNPASAFFRPPQSSLVLTSGCATCLVYMIQKAVTPPALHEKHNSISTTKPPRPTSRAHTRILLDSSTHCLLPQRTCASVLTPPLRPHTSTEPHPNIPSEHLHTASTPDLHSIVQQTSFHLLPLSSSDVSQGPSRGVAP